MTNPDSPFTFRSAVLADLPLLTPLYMSAFADALSQRCFPRTASTSTWWSNMNESEAQEPTAHYLLLEDPSLPPPNSQDDPGPILAYAKWNAPDRSHTGQAIASGGDDDPEELPTWPEGGDHDLATEFFGHLIKRRRAIMGSRPHWYLEIVATRPQFRGRGLAGRLIQWGVNKADESGIEAYLEAGPDLVNYYAKFGFEVVETFEPTRLKGHVESLMRRKARSGS